MSQYSETIGSFTRTGNYPLEANYIFQSEEELKQFYSDPIQKTTLHEGLFKIVKTDNEQFLYWVVNGENGLEFKKLDISHNDDFINVSGENLEVLTLSSAISKVDTNNRKLGQVITFKDSANSWSICQFIGDSLDNWSDTSLWKNISGIDELKSQVDDNTASIASLKADVSSNAQNIGSLADEIDRNSANINSLQSSVTTLETREALTTDTINGLKTTVSNLTSQVNTNTSNISSLNTEVSTLQSKVDKNTTSISQINNTIVDHEESIAQTNTKLEVAVSEGAKRADDIEKKIEKELKVHSKNRFNVYDKDINLKKVISSDGTIKDNQWCYLSPKIEIHEGETLCISAEYFQFPTLAVAQYDSDGNYIEGSYENPIPVTEAPVTSFVIRGAENAAYVLFSETSKMRTDHNIQAEIGDKRTAFISYLSIYKADAINKDLYGINITASVSRAGDLHLLEEGLCQKYVGNKSFVIKTDNEENIAATELQVKFNSKDDFTGSIIYKQVSKAPVKGRYFVETESQYPYVQSIFLKSIPSSDIGKKFKFMLYAGLSQVIEGLLRNDTVAGTQYKAEIERIKAVKIQSINPSFGIIDYKLQVNSQEDFDNIPISIRNALSAGKKNLLVLINQGRYYFKENHLYLTGNYEDSNIKMMGIGDVSIVPAGANYSLAESVKDDSYSHYTCPYAGVFDYNKAYIDGDGNVINLFDKDGLTFAESEVTPSQGEWVEGQIGYCKMKINHANMTEAQCESMYINITEWYLTGVYKVSKIEDGYVYFVVEKMEKAGIYWRVNADYNFSKRLYPRYRFVNSPEADVYVLDDNVHISYKYPLIHQCDNTTFIKCHSLTFGTFVLSNVTFVGSKGAGNTGLIDIYNSQFACFCVECVNAHDLNSKFLHTHITSNILVRNCCFYNNNNTICDNTNDCVNYEAANNKVYNNGCAFCQTTVFSIKGTSNAYIHDNYIKNQSDGCISSGLHYGFTKHGDVSFIIERNIIYNDSGFASNQHKYGLMDGGAIYVYTVQDSGIVRDNVIVRATSLHSQRGIFCDDGTKNVSIYGNVIIDTLNSFDIDLRHSNRAEMVEIVPDHNTNNVIIGNILTGAMRFEGAGNEDNCIDGKNIMFRSADTQDSLSVSVREDNVIISKYNVNDMIVATTEKVHSEITDLLISEYVREHIAYNRTTTYT